MASPLAALFDKRQTALARARFKAWWEGADFDEEAARRAIAQAEREQADPAPPDLDEALFDGPDIPISPRLAALALVWGEGRIAPGDPSAEALIPAQLGLDASHRLMVVGPGALAPLAALAAAHEGPIAAYEWREETAAHVNAAARRAGLGARVTVQRIDLETHAFEAESVDGIMSFDEFSFVDEPTRLAHHVAKALKQNACILIETYAGLPSPDIAPAFASAFAEPHIRAAGDIAHFLMESGLKIEAHEDITGEHVELARLGFKRLEEALKSGAGLEAHVARELAWEAEAWRTRLKMLTGGRLERRRIVARRA